jgi:hypothetical protein
MERASQYWQVAHAPLEDREAALTEVLNALAPAPADRPGLAAEARRMLARYGELFDE